MPKINPTIVTLALEADRLGVLVYLDEDDSLIQIRPDGGPDSNGDVTIYLDEDSDQLMGSEAGNEWPWVGTVHAYLRDRAATNNWT